MGEFSEYKYIGCNFRGSKLGKRPPATYDIQTFCAAEVNHFSHFMITEKRLLIKVFS